MEHDGEGGGGGEERDAGDEPVREGFADGEKAGWQAAQEELVEGAVFVVGAEKAVEREEGGKERADPDNAWGDPGEGFGGWADGQGEEGGSHEKEEEGAQGVAAVSGG